MVSEKEKGTFEHHIAKVPKKDRIEVTLPYVIKGATVTSPGVWNDTKFTKENIKKSYESMEFKRENTSLFLDHITAAETIIGEVKNLAMDKDGKVKGDLYIVDRNTAEKVAYGLHFGVSPTISVLEGDDTNPQRFEYINFSLVFEPAIRDAFINEEDNSAAKEEIEEEALVEEEEFAEWDTAFVNTLPDFAFAVIKSGGEKDEEDKTTPRDLRKLPHHGENVKDGMEHNTVDLPHLRNALARLEQTDLTEEEMASAREHLVAHAKALEVGDYSQKQFSDVLKEKITSSGLLNEEELAYFEAIIESYNMDHLVSAHHDECPEGYVKVDGMCVKTDGKFVSKESYEELVLQFKKLEEETQKSLEFVEKKNAQLNDMKALLKSKDKLVAKYEQEVSLEKEKSRALLEEKRKEEEARKQAKFNAFFDKYTKAYNITGNEIEETRRELATLSEAAIEKMGRDLDRTFTSRREEERVFNSQEVVQMKASVAQETKEMTPQQRTEMLFEKIKRMNQGE